MSFVDELIHSSMHATVVLVDKRSEAGGHWVDAYPFVRLHQPAAFYGVNSRRLGAGGFDLASKDQILAYYEAVLQELVNTGRVTWMPQCEYNWKSETVVSLLEPGRSTAVTVNKKVVDATALLTNVPSTHPPNYTMEGGAHTVPVNALARLDRPWRRYTVIGAGKTGIDAIMYLLRNGVSLDRLRWVVSNDCWYILRDRMRGNGGMFGRTSQGAILKAKDLADLCKSHEEVGIFARVDPAIDPTKMRAATVWLSEVEKLRQIKQVVREGRIAKITATKMVFTNGAEVETDLETLHIDCSTNSTMFRPPVPIFSPGRITLQMVQLPQPTHSGAVIAALELLMEDDNAKNTVVQPLDAPHDARDWFKYSITHYRNRDRIRSTLGFWWLWNRRLSGYNIGEFMGTLFALFVGVLTFAGLIDAKNKAVTEKLEEILGLGKETSKEQIGAAQQTIS